MLDAGSTSEGGLLECLEAAAQLAWLADPTVNIYRHGLRFEKSGDSLAVFDGEARLDRADLRENSERAFLEAVDLWLLNRYLAEVA